MSSLGVASGTILAMAGLIYINSRLIKSHSKILSGDFTDDDIIAYYREHEMVNKRALEGQSKIGTIVSIFLVGSLIYAADHWLTAEAKTMTLLSGISGFLVGFTFFLLI
jgi:hypothetical protein